MLQRPRTDIRRRVILGPGLAARAATRKGLGEENFPAEDGYEWTTLPPLGISIQPKSRMTGKRKLSWKTHLAGESDLIHRDLLDS